MFDLSIKEMLLISGGSCRCVCFDSSPNTIKPDREKGYVLSSDICSNECEKIGKGWVMRACYTRGCVIL